MPNGNDDDNVEVPVSSVANPFQLTDAEIENIKKNLGDMIDVMADIPSTIAYLSKLWGELPLWQKIIGGLIVTVPVLLLGFVTMIGAIVTFGICCLVAYACIGYLLDNHYACTSATTTGLKQGVNSLADLLGTVVQSLGAIQQEMSKGVEVLGVNNGALQSNVANFEGQVASMTDQVNILKLNVGSIDEAKATLELASTNLAKIVSEQKQASDGYKEQLAKAREALDINQRMLASTIQQFAEEKKNLETQVTALKALGDSLKGTVINLTNSQIGDDKQKKEVLDRLQDLMQNKSKGLESLSSRLSEQQQEITRLNSELSKANLRYENANRIHLELLGKHEHLIRRLEALEAARVAQSGAQVGTGKSPYSFHYVSDGAPNGTIEANGQKMDIM